MAQHRPIARLTTFVSAVLLLAITVGCGKDSPTAPTPVTTPTKIVRLSGSLAFGDVIVGAATDDRVVTVFNDGTAILNVSGITAPCANAAMSIIGVPAFAVAPSQSIPVTFRFRPTSVQSCSGTVTFTSDATSGTNTVTQTAAGVAPPRPTFSKVGSGDSVFDMPLDVQRVRVIGVYAGFSSNFIVKIGGRLIVNELIGTGWSSTRYDGTLLTGGGGVVSITNSSGVSWSFEELGR